MGVRISQDEGRHLAAGLLVLGLALLWPWVTDSPALGDQHIRWTIRLALAWYAAAASLMLTSSPGDWSVESERDGAGSEAPPARSISDRSQWARVFWTLAFVTYAVHVAVAMHHYHHWSHAHAFEHTRQAAGIGEGIYVSHAFGLWWGLDVAWWWITPEGYARRSPAMGRAMHAFMAFIWFNGTVVYEQGFIRWAGAGVFVVLGVLWTRRLLGAGRTSPA